MAPRTKWVNWFASGAGRQFMGCVAVGAGFGSYVLTWLPNTFLLGKFEEVVRLYRKGESVPVPAEVIARAETVKHDLKLRDLEKDLVKLFTVYGFDVFHAGSLAYNTGAIVGAPINFGYKTVDDIDKSSILVEQNTVHWSTPEGVTLQNALVLSEEAQKFAFAREISHLTTQEVTVHSLLNIAGVIVYYTLAYRSNRKLKAFERPLGFRVILYSILGLFACTFWLFVKDATTLYYERAADRKAMMDPSYTRGAVEFYAKQLQRNVALRGLLGDKGPETYSAYGNVNYGFRTPHLPITDRLLLAEARLAGLQLEDQTLPLVNV